MARVNIKKLEEQMKVDAVQLKTIKEQIELLPLEERLAYAEYLQQLKAEVRHNEIKARRVIDEQKRTDNLRFTWEMTKLVVGAVCGAIGFIAWATIFAMI